MTLRAHARQRRRVTRRLAVVIAALLALLPAAALAAEYVSGSDVRVTSPVTGDLYVFGIEVSIDATVNGDVIAAGGTVRITGDVRGSVYATAAQVEIDGNVDGTLMVSATDVRIAGNIGGPVRIATVTLAVQGATFGNDLVVAGILPGSEVTVDDASRITGELALRVSKARVQADIGGMVRGRVDNELELGGVVGGPIRVSVGNLRFTNGAVIAQPVDYTSDHEVLVDGGTTITGALTRVTPAHQSLEERLGVALAWALFRFVWAAALGAFLLRVAPGLLQGTATALRRRPFSSLGWGVLVLFLAPAAAFGLMLSVIGLPVGLVVLAGFLLALYASQLVLAVALGRAIAPARWRAEEGFWAAWKVLIVGLVVVVLARSLPITGWSVFSSLIVAILGLGALFVHWFRRDAPLDPGPRLGAPRVGQ